MFTGAYNTITPLHMDRHCREILLLTLRDKWLQVLTSLRSHVRSVKMPNNKRIFWMTWDAFSQSTISPIFQKPRSEYSFLSMFYWAGDFLFHFSKVQIWVDQTTSNIEILVLCFNIIIVWLNQIVFGFTKGHWFHCHNTEIYLAQLILNRNSAFMCPLCLILYSRYCDLFSCVEIKEI